MPFVWGSYWNYVMGTVGLYILLGLGMNIIVGLSGQLVLGYVAFFAIGAYAMGLLSSPEPLGIQLGFWPALLASILVAALTGILLGLPILNLRGDYLAIVTLGFGEIIRILIKSDSLTWFTGGPKGLRAIAQPAIFGLKFNSDVNFMHLILVGVLVGVFIAYRLQYSRTGRAWLSVQGDQTVSRATGVNTYQYKILALALGAAFAGIGGAIFASRNQFTGPEDHVLMVSINVLCLVIVGGMGSLPGVILGSFVLKGIPELLRDLTDYRLLVFGVLLVVMMIVRPEGLWPTRRPKLEKQHLSKYDPDNDEASSEEVSA
ncbi:MAG: ABC transporter ATP-binding protein [Anaerolineae bacterium]|nr:ABC transporter ATP-binding protein [Anaerolineae bacterium]